MDVSEEPLLEGTVAADLMLRDPKTLSGTASVADVRAQLANPKVQMVLLADGSAFRGAITTIPPEAADDEQALAYGETAPETIAPDASGDAAFRRASDSPHRRVIVVDDGGNLLGLLCLDPSRTRFCQTPGSSD